MEYAAQHFKVIPAVINKYFRKTSSSYLTVHDLYGIGWASLVVIWRRYKPTWNLDRIYPFLYLSVMREMKKRIVAYLNPLWVPPNVIRETKTIVNKNTMRFDKYNKYVIEQIVHDNTEHEDIDIRKEIDDRIMLQGVKEFLSDEDYKFIISYGHKEKTEENELRYKCLIHSIRKHFKVYYY